MAHVQTADFLDTGAPCARTEAGKWEMRAAALCLAQFSEPLFAAIAQSQGLTEPPGYARLFFIPIYGFVAWTLWRDRALAGRAIVATPLLTGLALLALASSFWSIDSGGTFRRAIWLTVTIVFALYLAWRYDWPRLLNLMAGAYAVLIAGSFAVSLLMPSVGVMASEHPGAWSGLWTHKNTLGGMMALGAPLAIAAAMLNPHRRKLWSAVALGAFALVLFSTSKTALLATMLGFAAIAAGVLCRRGPLHALAVAFSLGLGAIVLGGVFILAPDSIVALLGRDLTFTGRTDIWHAAAPAVAAHPWLGYGYYAFWIDDKGPAYWVRQAVGWEVPSAHNGWLELALGLGRIGIVLFTVQLIANGRRALAALLDPEAGLWAPAFLIAFGFYTLSESHILQANDLFWAIYVAVAARLSLDARAARKPL